VFAIDTNILLSRLFCKTHDPHFATIPEGLRKQEALPDKSTLE